MSLQRMREQFLRCLDSFEGYREVGHLRNEIDKGNIELLDMVIGEVEALLLNPTAKIIRKVLALRFVRDIMLLAKENVCTAVEKLLPYYLSICCHECRSSDPDRGENYFHSHPQYFADEEERCEIDAMGTTFLTLSLESVWQWAKWIPSYHSSNAYVMVYEFLFQKGVVFPVIFYYYKQDDIARFISKTQSFDLSLNHSHRSQAPHNHLFIDWLKNYGFEYQEWKKTKKFNTALTRAYQREKQLINQLNIEKQKSRMLQTLLESQKIQQKEERKQYKYKTESYHKEQRKYERLKQKYQNLRQQYQIAYKQMYLLKQKKSRNLFACEI